MFVHIGAAFKWDFFPPRNAGGLWRHLRRDSIPFMRPGSREWAAEAKGWIYIREEDKTAKVPRGWHMTEEAAGEIHPTVGRDCGGPSAVWIVSGDGAPAAAGLRWCRSCRADLNRHQTDSKLETASDTHAVTLFPSSARDIFVTGGADDRHQFSFFATPRRGNWGPGPSHPIPTQPWTGRPAPMNCGL